MSIQSEISACLEELEGDLSDAGEFITTAANAILPCVPSSEELINDVALGPQIEGNIVAVRVRKSYFVTTDTTLITADTDELLADNSTARPRSGVDITYRGKTYQCIRYSEDPSGAYFKIYMVSAR